MTTHIALFWWKATVSQREIDSLMADIKRLKNDIPEVVELYCGENFSQWNEGYTHAVVVITESKDALDAYRSHPAHVPIAKRVEELEEQSIGMDFES